MKEQIEILISVYKEYADLKLRTHIESTPIENIYTKEEVEIRKAEGELIKLVISDLEYIIKTN